MRRTGMAEKLTPKQEAFARSYLETGNAAEAYRRAYEVADDARDGWLYVEACQMLDNPKISLRLEELQAEAQRLSLFTIRKAAEEYEQARALAVKLDNPAAAVSAITGKVKLFGLDKPGRVEVTGRGGKPIATEEVGQASAKLASLIATIAERSTTAG